MEKVYKTSTTTFSNRLYTLIIFMIISMSGFSQNVGINTSGAVPNSNAGLDVDFPDKGVLIPRVALTSTVLSSPLSSHVAGMLVYNTATANDVLPGFYYNNGSAWIPGFPAANATGNMLYWNGTAWMNIPVGLPGQFLQLSGGLVPYWGGSAVLASLTTTAAGSITDITATSGGNVTSDNGSAVLSRGVCWGTTSGPTIANSKTTDGSGTGSFISNLTGLTLGSTYYVRAYAINSYSVSYGNEVSFTTTGVIPTLAATNTATAVTQRTATSGGNVINTGGSAITERGICYATTSGPTTANSKVTDPSPGLGSFVSNLTGLTASTTYHVRSYAINATGTAYGTEISFTTLAPVLPTLAATAAATLITASTATSGGNVTFDGGASITERGVCYGTTSNPTTANTKAIDSAPGTGTFVSSLTGLLGGTTYYVRAYATNSIGTAYGTQISFVTAVAPPTLVTVAATSISGASAISGGSMNWNGAGYSNYQNYGVCYSTVPNSATPTYVSTNTTNYSVNPLVNITPWVTNITGLAANTTYYIRSFLYVYRAGWSYVYGNELSVTTSAPTAPIIGATTAASLITGSTVRTGGTITSDGGSAITAKGVCWGITPNPTLGAGNFTTDGTGSLMYASNLTGLSGSTNYYVRAYATNAIGTSYAATDVTFTTSTASPYTLGQNVGYGIVGYVAPDGTGFIVSPNITFTGGWGCNNVNVAGVGTAIGTGQTNTDLIIASCGTSTAAGVARAYTGGGFNDWYLPSSGEWGQIASRFTSYGINSGNYYTSSQYGTNYTYASTYYNSGPTGTCYSSGALRVNGTFMGGGILAIRNFAASPAIASTIASTIAITNIAATSATSGGIIASDGGGAITAKGVCWSTTSGPTIANSKTINGTGTTSFVSSITGLTTGTPYYVRAYATNSVETSYGPEINFTPVAPGFPNVTTTAISNIGATTATSGGNVISDGGSSVTARGVCYGTASAPTISGTKTTDGTGIGAFVSNITGLTTGTLYYARAYATNANGTTYGAEYTFTPFTLATVTTDAITNIAATSATSGGNITSNGGSAVTARGVCWSTATSPTIANSLTVDGTGTGAFVSSLTGLTIGLTYYVRSYATNAAGTAYGNEVTFVPSGPTVPTITTDAVTSPTSTGGISGGNITNDGGSVVTARGICWNQIGSPTVGDTKTIDGSGTGTFVSTIAGLTSGLGYFIRAYATNSSGTGYGQEEYYIPIGLPMVATGQLAYTPLDAFAQVLVNITSDGGDPLTAFGLVWGTTSNPTVSSNLGFSNDVAGGIWYNFSLMQPVSQLTTYYVRAYATNGIGTSYGSEIVFTPGVLAIPTLTTDPIINKVGAIAEGGATVLNDGGDPIITAGLCWGTTVDPTIVSNSGMTIDGYFGQFFSNLSGLTVGTTYHVRAYATNSTGTAYGADVSFVATAAFIGQVIQGGWMSGNVYYVDVTGTHGLVGLTFSNSPADWGCTSSVTGAAGTALFTGLSNTNLISADITTNGCTSADPYLQFAAPLCQIQLGTYLPSKDEMDLLWFNRVASGLAIYLTAGSYWSSSEVDASHAWYLDTTTPTPTWVSTGVAAQKTAQYNAWPIWAF